MDLRRDFAFSQAVLQDYIDCRRRFLLRYVQRLAWPAVESEPVLENERWIAMGEQFHREAQQSLLGVPDDLLSEMDAGEELQGWRQNFTAALRPQGSLGKLLNGATTHPEVSLATRLEGTRLVAKYDLIALHTDGRALILDWKTSRRKPRRTTLESRMQTRVYPYLLARAGKALTGGGAIQPEAIEMIYWFAAFPDEPERFVYSVAQFEADEARLSGLIRQIRLAQEAEFSLTEDTNLCRFCVYRSLCERGVRAGARDEVDELAGEVEPRLVIDLDQIEEIEF
jgi:RecB family exonuclease